MMPKVSVIVPVYNVEKYLRPCLDSIINQTLQDIEIICIDDGSTDCSLDILNEYARIDDRLKVITQRNLFAGVARNTGMEVAQGEYYVFLDADDFFELDLLEKEFEKCKMFDADICLCDADKFDTVKKCYIENTGLLNLQYVESEVFNKNSLKEHIFDVTTACPWTKMFSANFIKKNNLTFQSLPRANDVFFVLSALGLAEKIVYVNEVLVHYRVNNKQSLQNNNKKTPGVFLLALEAIKEKLNLEHSDDNLKQAFSNVALGHLAYNLRSLEFERAYDEFLQVRSDVERYYLASFNLENKEASYFFNKNDLRYLLDKEIIKLRKTKKNIRKNKEENDILISFIVPVYNADKYVEECINSLVGQTQKNIEILCIDDKSTDQSLNILNKFAKIDSRIHVYSHSKNMGAGGARNTGLEYARGKYIWFIDADDFIDKDAVETLLGYLKQHDDKIDLLGFNADAFTMDGEQYIKSDGGIVRNWPQNEIIRVPKDFKRIPNSIEGSSVTYIAKRKLVNKYRFREKVAFEDADYSFKLYTSQANFFIIDYTPYHRRITSCSTTGLGAMGTNVNCIYGRILAANAILNYINENNICLEFAMKWYIKWTKWAIELYLQDEEIQDIKINQIIQLLQKKLQLFSLTEIMNNRSIFLPEIIVSLTTIPSRVNNVHLVIESLLRQTMQADKILLYIAPEQINEKELPKELIGLKKINPKFDIIFCEDIKPHKKYFFAMKENPEAIIITVDDDVIYNNALVKELILSYIKFPDSVSCMRGHIIKMYDEETVAPYKKWQREKKIIEEPSLLVLPTGVGGVLYPPHCMSKMLFDIHKIKDVALFTDDLWLKWMQLKMSTKCVLIKERVDLCYIKDSQNEALWIENIENKNNIAIRAILNSDSLLDRYNENILEKLFYEYEKTYQYNKVKSNIIFKNNQKSYSFILKKIRGGIRCYKEHGLRYTIKRTLYHMKLYRE